MNLVRDDFLLGLIFGILLGITFVWMYSITPNSIQSKYHTAIDECEMNLPRNQHCKIIGVVDDSNL